MLLSTSTFEMAKLVGDREALRRLAAIGFDAVDYSMFFHPYDDPLYERPLAEILPYYRGIKAAADAAGIAVEAAAVLECPYVVVHPLLRWGRKFEESLQLNVDFFGPMLPLFRALGVRLGVENMYGWDDALGRTCPSGTSEAVWMNRYIDTFNGMAGGEVAVGCLDLGHATLAQQRPEEMIPILGDRLRLLHVQDTDGVSDLHMIPYLGGAVDWDAVCAALARAGYTGAFSFETDYYFKAFPPSMREDAFRFEYAIGRRLIERITG